MASADSGTYIIYLLNYHGEKQENYHYNCYCSYLIFQIHDFIYSEQPALVLTKHFPCA